MFWYATSAIPAGSVKTTWKYPTGSRSNWRSASQGAGGRTLALGAVPIAAGVVGDALVAAVRAGLEMTAKGGGAAVLDRRHDLELLQAQVPGLGGAVGGTGGPQDVGDLERGRTASVGGSALSCGVWDREHPEPVERADHRARGHPGV